MGISLPIFHSKYGHLSKKDMHARIRASQDLSSYKKLDTLSNDSATLLIFVKWRILVIGTITFSNKHRITRRRDVIVTVYTHRNLRSMGSKSTPTTATPSNDSDVRNGSTVQNQQNAEPFSPCHFLTLGNVSLATESSTLPGPRAKGLSTPVHATAIIDSVRSQRINPHVITRITTPYQ